MALFVWGTASLKFRQFNSAVCDAFGVFWFWGGVSMGCSLLGGCRIVRVVRFNILGGVLIFGVCP